MVKNLQMYSMHGAKKANNSLDLLDQLIYLVYCSFQVGLL
jgi:hypothetical protein